MPIRTSIQKTIVDVVARMMRDVHFEKDGYVWFRKSGGIISMLALDPSPYGFPVYGLLTGLHVRELDHLGARYTKKGALKPMIGQ